MDSQARGDGRSLLATPLKSWTEDIQQHEENTVFGNNVYLAPVGVLNVPTQPVESNPAISVHQLCNTQSCCLHDRMLEYEVIHAKQD